MGEIILDTGINTAGLKAGSKEMLSAIRSFGSRVKSGSRDVTRAVQSFGKQSTRQILSTGKSVLSMIAGVSSAMSVLHKAISSYMSKHQETAAKLQTAWGALGEVMGPVLERVVNLITTAISYLITFLHLVGLSSKTASQAAADANKAAGAMQRSILSFDDLTKLQGGGGGGATGTLQDIDPDEWMKKLTELLKEGMWRDAGILLGLRVNELIDSVDWISIGDKIGYNFGGAISTIAWSIRTIDWKNLGAQLVSGFNAMISNINGADLGSLLVAKWTIVIDILGGFFEGVAYEEIGEKLNAMLNQAIEDLTKSIQNADTDKIGTGLGQMLAKIDWIRLGKNFGAFLRWSFLKATDLFIAFLKSTPWKDIGDGIGAMFNEIDWNEVGTIIFEILGLAFQAGVGLLIGFLQTTSWKDVGEGLRAMIGKIDPKEIGDELFGVLKAAAQAAFDLLDGFFGGNDTYSKIKGWLNDIVETFREFAHTIQMVSDVTSGKKTWSEALEEMRKYSEERQRLQMEAAGYKVVPEIPSSDDTELEGLTSAADALTHKLTEAGNAYRTLVQTDYSEANQKKFESVVRAIYQMLTEPYQDVEEAQTAVENLEAALQGVIDSYSELAENPTDKTWEAVNGKLIEELRKHCDDYAQAVEDATMAVEENGDIITKTAESVSYAEKSKAAEATDGVAEATEQISHALSELDDNSGTAGRALLDVGENAEKGASAGEEAFRALCAEIVGMAEDVSSELGQLNVDTILVDAEIEPLPDSEIDKLNRQIADIESSYRDLMQEAYSAENQSSFESAINAVAHTLTESYLGIEEAQPAVKNLEAALQDVIEKYSELAKSPTVDIAAANEAMFGELKKACDGYVDELKDANLLIEENGRVIQAASKDADSMVASTAAVRDAQNGSTNAAADVGNALLNMGDSADSAGAAFEGLGDDMRIGASEGEAAITAMHEEIVSGMSDLVGDVDKSSLAMSESFAEGATEMGEKASEMTRDVNNVMQQNMATIASNAYIWGQDIMNEFARGMVSRFNSTLAPALYSVAKGIWSYLHFSEPEVGPLSDFHTYMPDMMRLMAEGIAQNRDLPIGAVENVTERIAGTVGKIQDIANNVVFTQPQIAAGNLLPYSVSGGINAGGIDSSGTSLSDVLSAISSLRSAITGSGNGEITLNLVVELDGEKITEKVTRLQRRDLRAIGV